MNGGLNIVGLSLRVAKRDRQAEPPRPSTSRVEVEHASLGPDLWPMPVARDDHIDAARSRIKSQFIQVMQDVMERLSISIVMLRTSCPAVGVDIPPNRGDRSNPAELVEDSFPANVASMNDMGDTGELRRDLRAKQAVGIRDDPDCEHSVDASTLRRLVTFSAPSAL